MMKFLKILSIGIILSLIGINLIPAVAAPSNTETTGIPIKRKYIIAQVSGEIVIKDTFSYKKSIIPDRYSHIEINGTVTNSTLLNPFSIWPPLSILPGLRMLFLTDNSLIHMKIEFFKGKFYTKNNETSVRFYGMGLLVNISAILEI